MEEKLFQVLKKETLFSCYEALAKHEFDERDLPKLSKLLEPIFIRTEAYVCTVTSDNIDTAVNMKENVDKFLEKLKKFDSNFLIREMIEELEKLWNVIKRLSDIRQKSNEKEYGKQSSDVTRALEWFKNNSFELFKKGQNHIKAIEETLNNECEKSSFVDKLSPFVYSTISLINSFLQERRLLKWERTMYIYDGGKKCCVAFYVKDENFGEYYVDKYGNFFLSEIEFLQTMRKFYGYHDFFNLKGKPLYVRLLYDDDFLKMNLKAFQRINQGAFFSDFITRFESREEELITLLKTIKIFFSFVSVLNCCCNVRVSYVCNNVLKIYTDVDDVEVNIKKLIYNFDQFIKDVHDLNANKFSYDTPYLMTVERFIEKYGVKDDIILLRKYEMQINQRSNCYKNIKTKIDDYVNICHYIATKIIKPTPEESKYKSKLRLAHLKDTFFWVAEKYKDVTDIVYDWKMNEEDVKYEFHNLIKAVSEKSKKHIFLNDYAAAYYFSKHYNSIAETIKTNNDELAKSISSFLLYPKLSNTNVKKCATAYVINLPDFVFDEKYCVESITADSTKQNAVVKWQFFEAYSIKGTKVTVQNGKTFIHNLYADEKLLDFDIGMGSSVSSTCYGSDIEIEMDYSSGAEY